MKTLLEGVNDVSKLVQVISGTAQEFTSLTDPSLQHDIDLIKKNWNVVLAELYSVTGMAHPQELSFANITLVSGQRDYDLPNDMVHMRWPLHNKTTGEYIYEYEGGYERLSNVQQIPANEKGKPLYGAIRPSDSKLYLDKIPQSAEVGLVYELKYDKEVFLTVKDDVFPFNDAVYTALLDAVAERYRRDKRRQFDEPHYRKSMATAGKYLTKKITSDSYLPVRSSGLKGTLDPYNA